MPSTGALCGRRRSACALDSSSEVEARIDLPAESVRAGRIASPLSGRCREAPSGRRKGLAARHGFISVLLSESSGPTRVALLFGSACCSAKAALLAVACASAVLPVVPGGLTDACLDVRCPALGAEIMPQKLAEFSDGLSSLRDGSRV